MIILLRGHIRNSFDTQYLYELMQYLSNNYNIEIYIHTWDIIQNNISWREIKENNIVTFFQRYSDNKYSYVSCQNTLIYDSYVQVHNFNHNNNF